MFRLSIRFNTFLFVSDIACLLFRFCLRINIKRHICREQEMFSLPLNVCFHLLTPRFSLLPVLRISVPRRLWDTGKAQSVCCGLWDNCSSCYSTRPRLSESKWWFERLKIWSSWHESQELQVKICFTLDSVCLWHCYCLIIQIVVNSSGW